MSFSLSKKLAGVAVAAAVLGGAGAVAWADSSTTTPPATTPPATTAPAATTNAKPAKAHQAGGFAGILHRADHGVIEVKIRDDGGHATWQTVTFDRGKVSTVTQDSITLARPDGQSVTLKLADSTRYHGVTGWRDLKTQKGAIVISRDGTATQVFQPKPKANG
jgi:hypothetical protein